MVVAKEGIRLQFESRRRQTDDPADIISRVLYVYPSANLALKPPRPTTYVPRSPYILSLYLQ